MSGSANDKNAAPQDRQIASASPEPGVNINRPAVAASHALDKCTPTPRTDAEVKRLNYSVGGSTKEWEVGMADFARQLERELAEAREDFEEEQTVRRQTAAELERVRESATRDVMGPSIENIGGLWGVWLDPTINYIWGFDGPQAEVQAAALALGIQRHLESLGFKCQPDRALTDRTGRDA